MFFLTEFAIGFFKNFNYFFLKLVKFELIFPTPNPQPPPATECLLFIYLCIIDNKTKAVNIFELTCPGEQRIDVANKLKKEKYQHFLKDITQYKPSVIPFEVGSNTGHISQRNKQNFNLLHKYCKKNINLNQFKNNISAISGLSSLFIFNCRNEKNWEPMDYILPPLN